MHIFTKGTVSMWIENHKDGMHVVSEIDDDDMGFKNEVHYIISPEAVKSLYAVISEKDFIDLCRKGWSSGLEDFLQSNQIPYKISQPFGTTPDGFPDFYKQFGYKGHNGIDFYGVKNDYIFTACDGYVKTAHFDSTGYGNLTVIEDNDGGQHYYGHQNAISVKVGDTVKAGHLIGYMGNTGNVIGGSYSDGTHLHYGYRPAGCDRNNGYGGFIDPMPFFERAELPETVDAGWAEIVCGDGANVRDAPAGRFVTWFPKGIRVHKTGIYRTANSLIWEKIDGKYWIARADSYGTVMLKDVE